MYTVTVYCPLHASVRALTFEILVHAKTRRRKEAMRQERRRQSDSVELEYEFRLKARSVTPGVGNSPFDV